MSELLQCPACGYIGIDQALSHEWWDCLGSDNGAFCPECDADVLPIKLIHVDGKWMKLRASWQPPEVVEREADITQLEMFTE